MKTFSDIGAQYGGVNSYGFDFNEFQLDISNLVWTNQSDGFIRRSIKTALLPLINALIIMNSKQEYINIYQNLIEQVNNIYNMLV